MTNKEKKEDYKKIPSTLIHLNLSIFSFDCYSIWIIIGPTNIQKYKNKMLIWSQFTDPYQNPLWTFSFLFSCLVFSKNCINKIYKRVQFGFWSGIRVIQKDDGV